MRRRRFWIALTAITVVAAGCSQLRHPLDDSETKPDTQEAAIEEATTTLDDVGGAALAAGSFTEEVWEASDRCSTAAFAPSQGDVSSVLIRTYAAEEVGGTGAADQLLDEYESYWSAKGESVSWNSESMDPSVVARVNGIGYDLTSVPPNLELRAFIPCY